MLSGITLSAPTTGFAQSFVPGAANTAAAPRPSKSTITAVPSPTNQLEPIKLFDYRDPNSQELIRFSYQPSTRKQLAEVSPSKYRTQLQGFGPQRSLGASAKKLAVDFLPEYLAFTTAMGLNQGLHLENNPVFAKNFADQNVSFVGGVSFAGFLVGARSSHSFLQVLGLAHDPQRSPLNLSLRTPYYSGGPTLELAPDAKGRMWMNMPETVKPNYFETRSVLTPRGPTKVQRIFAPLVGPMGLAAGMTVSNIIHEIYADKDMHACVLATMRDVPLVKSEEARMLVQASIDEACDRAWEAWSRKAGDWTPDILSMGAASLIQGYLANPAIALLYGQAKKGATAVAAKGGVKLGADAATGAVRATAVQVGRERIVPYVLQGARFFRGLTGMHPVGRFVMTTGNIWLFMEIVHPLSYFTKPWEQSRQGRDITDRINSAFYELDRAEKNKWVWAPRPNSDFCTGFELDPMGAQTPNMACYEPEQHDPAHLLKKLADRQAKWREFVLQDAYIAHKDWQSYVANYATMYGNASAFYQQVVQLINYQRFHPRAKSRPAYLYVADPFYGLYSDPENKDEASAKQAIADARAWLETYNEGVRLKSRNSNFRSLWTERTVLPDILTGLRAMDESIPVEALGASESRAVDLKKLTPAQRVDFESRLRRRLLSTAIEKLRAVLKDDAVYNDRNIRLDSPEYKRRAETNPFMAIRLRLGDPEPMAEGLAFIRQSNDDATVIEQTSKKDHPGGIGRVRTDSMADFLLASMVCGPEADPKYSDSQKIAIFRKRKMGYAEALYHRLGIGRRSLSATDAAVMNAVQEQIEEDAKTKSNLLPNPKTGATSHEWLGFSAEFRPPRIVEGIPASICQGFADNSNRDLSTYDGNSAVWTINGEKYQGLLDIIRKKARPDLVGTVVAPEDDNFVSPFTKWWDVKVNAHTEIMVAKFRASYRELLEDKYLPALTGIYPKEGFWLSALSAIGLRDHGSVKYNGRDFKLGALDSLYDEADFYLKIVGRVSGIPLVKKDRKTLEDLSAGLLLEYKNMGSLVTDLELVIAKSEIAKAQFESKRKSLETKIDELKAFVDQAQAANKVGPDAVKVNEQAFKI